MSNSGRHHRGTSFYPIIAAGSLACSARPGPSVAEAEGEKEGSSALTGSERTRLSTEVAADNSRIPRTPQDQSPRLRKPVRPPLAGKSRRWVKSACNPLIGHGLAPSLVPRVRRNPRRFRCPANLLRGTAGCTRPVLWPALRRRFPHGSASPIHRLTPAIRGSLTVWNARQVNRADTGRVRRGTPGGALARTMTCYLSFINQTIQRQAGSGAKLCVTQKKLDSGCGPIQVRVSSRARSGRAATWSRTALTTSRDTMSCSSGFAMRSCCEPTLVALG